jgi:DNA-binding MurR/RpiR family transcriptional regulator
MQDICPMETNKDLFERLKDHADGYSPQQKAIAKFILGNYQRVAFTTIKELSRLSAASEATIVRFVKALGFTGYPAFLREIRRAVRKDLKSHERFQLASQSQGPGNDFLSRFIAMEIENLASLKEIFDEAIFRKVVSALRNAEEVMVIGSRSTASLAQHLWFGLTKVGVRSQIVTAVTTETYDKVSRMGARDLVVVIGFPRYLKELFEVLEFAKSRKIRTVTLTDSFFSPLLGDLNLFCPAESASFIAFHGAPLLLINALLDTLSLTNKESTVAALDRFEKLAERRGYFVKT